MEKLLDIKTSSDGDFNVEYEVSSIQNNDNIELMIEETENEIEKLNSEIHKFTNHADVLDYMIAVASGMICGVIDILFGDDLSFENANEWGNEKINNFVTKIANWQGYKGNELSGAVDFLEKKYPIAADKHTSDFGGGLQHHLRDFSHHPTPVGLIFSILTQFTEKVYGTDTIGKFKVIPLNESALALVGKNIPEKITFGVINWFFHMVSDMAGSSGTIKSGGTGTGLPGPLVSLLKEISALPFFEKLNNTGNKEFSVWISKLFNGTLLGERNENGKLVSVKFDLRTEIGLLPQAGKQAMPIIINECVVRGFYFVRHIYAEIKNNGINDVSELKKVNLNNVMPFKNRTIIRMLTISLGAFEAIDIADAAIESAIKSHGNALGFTKNMILKVNIVGIGRFAVAVGEDIGMGIKRNGMNNKKLQLIRKQFSLYNAKVSMDLISVLETIEENSSKAAEAKERIQTAQLNAEKYIEQGNELYAVNQRKLEGLL